MTATATKPSDTAATARAGTLALVLGALFALSTIFTYVLSIEALYDAVLGDTDPPNWLRGLALSGLPLGFFGTPIAYAYARNGPGRGRALVGLALLVVALVAFIALQFAMG